jgi:hypothetical protein
LPFPESKFARVVVSPIVRVPVPDCNCAEQLAFEPPLDPEHDHDHGPEPLTVDDAPELQRFVAGALVKVPPFAEPHTPLTSAGAEQLAEPPPFAPVHDQFHGPAPVT